LHEIKGLACSSLSLIFLFLSYLKQGVTAMNSQNKKKLINAESEWHSNLEKKGLELPVEREVPIVRGRVNAILRVDQPDDSPGTEIQLRKLFFYLNKERPSFFMLAEGVEEFAGMALRLSGDDLMPGKQYKISHGLRDVDARFDKEGLTIYPRTVAEGTLTIRSIDDQSVEGFFRFTFSNFGRHDKKKIDFYCTGFVVNFKD
jgi:hypothetical protein